MTYDRAAEDIGNVVEFGHVNTRIPDQQLATLFYVSGLGLTRDPFLMVGVNNMWINVGGCQFHLPTGPAQVVRGVIGLVLPDLDALARRLRSVEPGLAGTRFAFTPGRDVTDVCSPWGNRIRCHAPGDQFGAVTLGIPYLELEAPIGSSPAIARFYHEMLGAHSHCGHDERGAFAHVAVGRSEALVYRETDAVLADFDGNHVQIGLNDFSGPHRRLHERGLVTEESNKHQYRFEDIIDLDTGRKLLKMEHEVRSMRHPMYARALINRNPAQTNDSYAPGHESMAWHVVQS